MPILLGIIIANISEIIFPGFRLLSFLKIRIANNSENQISKISGNYSWQSYWKHCCILEIISWHILYTNTKSLRNICLLCKLSLIKVETTISICTKIYIYIYIYMFFQYVWGPKYCFADELHRRMLHDVIILVPFFNFSIYETFSFWKPYFPYLLPPEGKFDIDARDAGEGGGTI